MGDDPIRTLRRRSFLLTAAGLIASAPAYGRTAVRVAHIDGAPDGFWATTPGLLDGPNPIALRMLAERVGFSLTFEAFPWARAQYMVMRGQMDALMTIPNDERRGYAIFTKEPLLIYPSAILYLKDHPRRAEMDAAERLEDLRPFIFVYNEADSLMKSYAESRPLTDPSPNNEAVFRKIVAGRGDFTTYSMVRSRFMAKSLGFDKRLVIRPFPFSASLHHFGLRKTFPDVEALMAEVDRAVTMLRAEGRLEAIVVAASS